MFKYIVLFAALFALALAEPQIFTKTVKSFPYSTWTGAYGAYPYSAGYYGNGYYGGYPYSSLYY